MNIRVVKGGPILINIDKPTNSTKIQFTKDDKIMELDTVIEKVAFCTCDKSTQYPFCDGSHNMTNEEYLKKLDEAKKKALNENTQQLLKE